MSRDPETRPERNARSIETHDACAAALASYEARLIEAHATRICGDIALFRYSITFPGERH